MIDFSSLQKERDYNTLLPDYEEAIAQSMKQPPPPYYQVAMENNQINGLNANNSPSLGSVVTARGATNIPTNQNGASNVITTQVNPMMNETIDEPTSINASVVQSTNTNEPNANSTHGEQTNPSETPKPHQHQ